jgi:glutathione S-transferase
MSEFVIHGVPGSPYVQAVLMGLEEKGRSWRLAPLAPGASKSPEHLARHPFGRVPAVEHGDFQIYETQAVLRYLDRIYPEPALIPADPRTAARMDQIIGITDWYLMPHVGAPIVFPRVIAPRIGFPADSSKVSEAMPKAQVCIGEIARLLGDQDFLAGDDLSLADLMVAPQLSLTVMCEEGRRLMAPYPALAAWLERMQARPSMIATGWDRLLEMAKAA